VLGFISSSWPSLENIFPELKTILPNACLRQGFGRQADFITGGYLDPSSLRYDATRPLGEPKHREGSFGDHTGY